MYFLWNMRYFFRNVSLPEAFFLVRGWWIRILAVAYPYHPNPSHLYNVMYDVCTYVIVSHYNDILPVHWICWPPLAKHVPSHPFCLLISKALKVLGILLCMAGNAATLLGNDTQSSQKGPQRTEEGVTPSWGGLAARYLKKWSWCFCDPPWLAQSIIYLYIHAYMYKCIYIYIHHESYPSGYSSIEQKKILGGRRAQVSASKVNAATHEMWEAVGLRNSSPRINQLFAELMRGPLLVNDRHPYQGLNLLQRMGQLPALGQIFCHKINIFWLQSMQNSSGRRLKKGPKLLTRAPCGRLHAPW